MIPSPDETGRPPRRDRTDDRRDLPPELRVVVLDDCLADACRTAQDILDLAADVRINMIDIRGGDLLQRLLRRARRAGKVRALIKAAHERFPDHDDLTWLHDSMFGRPPSRPATTPPAGPVTADRPSTAGHPATAPPPAPATPPGIPARPDALAPPEFPAPPTLAAPGVHAVQANHAARAAHATQADHAPHATLATQADHWAPPTRRAGGRRDDLRHAGR